MESKLTQLAADAKLLRTEDNKRWMARVTEALHNTEWLAIKLQIWGKTMQFIVNMQSQQTRLGIVLQPNLNDKQWRIVLPADSASGAGHWIYLFMKDVSHFTHQEVG